MKDKVTDGARKLPLPDSFPREGPLRPLRRAEVRVLGVSLLVTGPEPPAQRVLPPRSVSGGTGHD